MKIWIDQKDRAEKEERQIDSNQIHVLTIIACVIADISHVVADKAVEDTKKLLVQEIYFTVFSFNFSNFFWILNGENSLINTY